MRNGTQRHARYARTPEEFAYKPSRTDVCRLIGAALCDERTAIKALTVGPELIRGVVGERVTAAMRTLGLRPLSEASQHETTARPSA